MSASRSMERFSDILAFCQGREAVFGALWEHYARSLIDSVRFRKFDPCPGPVLALELSRYKTDLEHRYAYRIDEARFAGRSDTFRKFYDLPGDTLGMGRHRITIFYDRHPIVRLLRPALGAQV